MAANSDWMPYTWAGKAAMFANIRAKIAGYATELGLAAGEVTEAQELCDEYTAVYGYHTASLAASSALTAWRDEAMTGKPEGKPLGDPPAAVPFVMPTNAQTGILNIFRKTRDAWVSAPGYTDAIGEDLMIVAPDSQEASPETVTPTIQASAAQTGYMIGVTVSDRAGADMWIVDTRQKAGDWKEAGSFTGKTADITITPLTPGDPELVEIRVRLRRKNASYGNPSQIATVTVNP